MPRQPEYPYPNTGCAIATRIFLTAIASGTDLAPTPAAPIPSPSLLTLCPTTSPNPNSPDTLLLFEAEEEDHVEDVTNHLDQKIAALLEHRTQWRSTMAIDPDHPDTGPFEQRIRNEAEHAALDHPFRYAEAFKRIEPL